MTNLLIIVLSFTLSNAIPVLAVSVMASNYPVTVCLQSKCELEYEWTEDCCFEYQGNPTQIVCEAAMLCEDKLFQRAVIKP